MGDESTFFNHWTDSDKQEVMELYGPILVVGASGFIGSNLYFNLSECRNDVYAASLHVQNSWRLLNGPSFASVNAPMTVDVANSEIVEEVLQHLRPRTIFNLSAYGGYERQSSARRIHEVNYAGNVNLISSLMNIGCDAFVTAGSSSEYGTNCAGPSEFDELSPNSDYAVSKVASAFLIKYYGQIKEFPCVNLRLYSVYGPWEERDRLIPTLVRNGLEKRYPSFVDADISRDFVYVDDCCRAFVRAAQTVCKTDPGLSINVSTGVKTSLRDAVEIARRLFDIPGEPEFGEMTNRKWDLSNWYGNPALALEKMGWKNMTTFEEGLRLTTKWEKHARRIVRFGIIPKIPKRISAIIACYKDHEAIPVMYQRLSKVFQDEGVGYEIIFVNDCSPTADEAVIQALCSQDPHVIGISHSRNFGSQAAFLSGMDVSTGDAVVLLDGDLQDPPEVIPELIREWNNGFEVVYGVRTKREAPLYMQILYKCFYRFFKYLASINIPVDAGDFSLIDRKAVNYLLSFPEKDVFLRGLRAWIGFRQTGVPYVRPDRLFGKTTNSFFKNIWWAKKAVFSFSVKPLVFIEFLGISMFIGSIALILFYLIEYFIYPFTAPAGVTTMVLLLLGVGGMVLFSIGILGDYLGKVLEEVKSRPRFIRNCIFKGHQIMDTQPKIDDFVAALKGDHSERFH